MNSPAINPFQNSPAMIPLLALMAGIGLSDFGMGLLSALCFFLAGAVIYLLLLYFKCKPALALRYSQRHFLWIALWFIALGIVVGDLQRPYSPSGDNFSQFKTAQGRIEEISDRTSGEVLKVRILQMTTPTEKIVKPRNLSIIIHTDASAMSPGDIIQFPVRLKRISDSPNSFFENYAKTMETRGILYSMSAESQELRKVGESPSILHKAGAIRDRLSGFIETTPLDKKTKYFLNSLLLGDRAYLLPDTREIFVDAGIAHVLALSGMHVGIISAVILFLLFPINFAGLYRWRLLLTGIILWGYALISGMSPSTVRACIMMSLVFISIFTQRKSTSFNALCVAGLIILLFDPRALFDIGFQLSFICVAVIILFVNRLNNIDQRSHGRTYKLIGAILTTLVTTVATWIIIAYYYERFPLSFIPANLIILPILPLFVILSLVFLLLHGLGWSAPWLSGIIDKFFAMIEGIAKLTGSPGPSVLQVSPSLLSVLLWIVGISAIAIALYSSRKRLFYSLGLSFLTLSLISIPLFNKKHDSEDFMVCDTYHAVEMKVRKGNAEQSIFPPAGQTSLVNTSGIRIITLGAPETEKSLWAKKQKLLEKSSDPVDMVIVTGANRLSLKKITKIFKPVITVIHPSVRKAKELQLLSEADSLSIRVHSLRLHNPLRLQSQESKNR